MPEPQIRKGRGRRRASKQGMMRAGELAIGRSLPSHLCRQNIGSHRIPGQLVGICDGESAPLALLVQEGVRGLGTLAPRQRLFTLTVSSVAETHVLIPGRQCVGIRGFTEQLSR